MEKKKWKKKIVSSQVFGKESENIIGTNSFFKGKLKPKGNLHIDGKYEGDLIEANLLTIGLTGKVRSDIVADSIIIEGVVIGKIKAKILILLLSTAKVLGDIEAPELIMQNGVLYEGHCFLSRKNNLPTKKSILDFYEKE